MEVAGTCIPSTSFADDLALIATSLGDIEALIAAYLEWCQLLGVRVTKVQLWCSRGAGFSVCVAESAVVTSSTFKIVGGRPGAV